VSDRYVLANVVYQGHAGGLDLEAIRAVGRVAVDGVWPDAVFVLDMDPAAADARMQRSLDRMERQGNVFREQLRTGFLFEASRNTNNTHVIDAGRDVDTIQSEIRQIAERVLAESRQ
jgi:dTMP kinase